MRITYWMLLPFISVCLVTCGDGGTANNPDACVSKDEVCNGLDDDCDGLTDEDLDLDQDQDMHYSLTSCRQPNDDCDDLDAEVYPGHPESPFFCDGKDNDCDRSVDEDCECNPGPPPDQKECSTDEGECTRGQMVCLTGGVYSECSGILPQDERCDGKDNDCDGTTDNPKTLPSCELTAGVCQSAVRTSCEPCDYGPSYAPVDNSCDGLDNDCDGYSDDDLAADGYENNNSCLVATSVPGLMEEGGPKSVLATLYRYDLGVPVQDEDWYSVHLEEDTHIIDCGTGGPHQCFETVLLLDLPPGANHLNWEMCALDTITGGSCGHFGDTLFTACTSPNHFDSINNQYYLTYQWDGHCDYNDSGDFTILVRGMGTTVADCHPYQLIMEMRYFGTRPCP